MMISEQQKVDAWNKNVAIGAPVTYRTDLGADIETTTRTAAELLGGHTAVVWLDTIAGCVALGRVTPRS